MTRRILQAIQLDKIAVVDRPCQEGAVMTIMKRAPDESTSSVDPAAIKRFNELRQSMLVGKSVMLKIALDKIKLDVPSKLQKMRDALLDRMVDLQKQGFYVGIRHPEKGFIHHNVEAGNRRGARTKALKDHPGGVICRLHRKNMKKQRALGTRARKPDDMGGRRRGASSGKDAGLMVRQGPRGLAGGERKMMLGPMGLGGGRAGRSKSERGINKATLMEGLLKLKKVLSAKAGASDWIDDFVHSDHPNFKGKSKKERIRMALGAYYGRD